MLPIPTLIILVVLIYHFSINMYLSYLYGKAMFKFMGMYLNEFSASLILLTIFIFIWFLIRHIYVKFKTSKLDPDQSEKNINEIIIDLLLKYEQIYTVSINVLMIPILLVTALYMTPIFFIYLTLMLYAPKIVASIKSSKDNTDFKKRLFIRAIYSLIITLSLFFVIKDTSNSFPYLQIQWLIYTYPLVLVSIATEYHIRNSNLTNSSSGTD